MECKYFFFSNIQNLLSFYRFNTSILSAGDNLKHEISCDNAK